MKFIELQVSLPCFQERVHNSIPVSSGYAWTSEDSRFDSP